MKCFIGQGTLLFVLVSILLVGCNRYSVKNAQESLDSATDHDQHVLTHQDGLHPSHHTAYTQVPEAPAGNDFFKTIEFPMTPPVLEGGHYISPKRPFTPPDFVSKYPNHFILNDSGEWQLRDGTDKLHRIDMIHADDTITDEERIKRVVTIASEGFDKIATGAYLSRLIGCEKEGNRLLDEVYAENPDDFYLLLHWAMGHQVKKNVKEAETEFCRLIELYPDSIEAKHNFAYFLIETRDELNTREAIYYLEAVFAENPWWYGPLYKLGEAYYSLENYEKSLVYFEAVDVFTGYSLEGSAFFKHLIREQPVMKKECVN